jgi:hypothetical protein
MMEYIKEVLEPFINQLTYVLLVEKPDDPDIFLYNWLAEKLKNVDLSHRSSVVKVPNYVGMRTLSDSINEVNEQKRIPEACRNFKRMTEFQHYKVFDINMYQDAGLKNNLLHYYNACIWKQGAPVVTTSCFTPWRKAGKTNKAGKVIPAIPVNADIGSDQVRRVFFFDDNINLHLGGTSDAEGLCNLRDITTGDYVDFSVGQNGFQADHVFRRTVVHHSSQYRNVLVAANIIDAMANVEYFTHIIIKYTKPGERVLVFADVNGTIVFDDTSAGKDMSEVVLHLLFRFCEIRPKKVDGGSSSLNFAWQDKPACVIDKPVDLRSLIAKILKDDNEAYRSFWRLETCREFVSHAATTGDLIWAREEGCIDSEIFFAEYEKSHEQIQRCLMKDGIPQSWFQCYAFLLDQNHQVVLNSFGIDTFRVIRALALDDGQILQLTINYDLWSERDAVSWRKQFESSASTRT